MLAAIRRASSRVSRCAAERRLFVCFLRLHTHVTLANGCTSSGRDSN